MKKNLKDINLFKTAAIHDLSCFGRCALTVVIPVLSAMGIQTVPLPTALLSTHTGGFNGFSFLDLTEQMEMISEHWSELDLKFDAIYSGFLGSEDQVDIVKRFIERFRSKDTIVLVDPVMGDNGVLYKTMTTGICGKMRELTNYADIITPNMTEAFFLLDIPVSEHSMHTEELVNDMLYRLSEYTSKVVITGVRLKNLNEEFTGTASYDRASGIPVLYNRKTVNKHYPGTGDIFASVLLGNMISGMNLTDSAKIASDFVYEVIADTARFDLPGRNGVLLEKNLYKLMNGVKRK